MSVHLLRSCRSRADFFFKSLSVKFLFLNFGRFFQILFEWILALNVDVFDTTLHLSHYLLVSFHKRFVHSVKCFLNERPFIQVYLIMSLLNSLLFIKSIDKIDTFSEAAIQFNFRHIMEPINALWVCITRAVYPWRAINIIYLDELCVSILPVFNYSRRIASWCNTRSSSIYSTFSILGTCDIMLLGYSSFLLLTLLLNNFQL